MHSTKLTNLLFVAFSTLATSQTAKLTSVPNFGTNPSSLTMNIYVPNTLATKPPIIIVPHPCGGSAQDTFSRVATNLPTYADKLGLILIYPATPTTSACWDVRSNASMTHDGGGDTLGLISMVNYILTKYAGDPTKVFVTGSSSGGMMTNLLLAAYPDVFAAGAVSSGAPVGCWDGTTPNSIGGPYCQAGKTYSATQWGEFAVESDRGFNGTRPRFMTWHGTADRVVAYVNLGDQLKQWSSVLGVQWTGNVTDSPEKGYTKMVYGDGTRMVGYSALGVGHMVPFHAEEMLEFFGLL
ncbi:alpha/beta-hydrolase [Mollisia scopiformis]|uniref:Carboxylic ester hydrolase n=1 Tax=Mollisia scopiformis TaxID=149040 RepID=A0A132BDC7_MOLSC|nr:alpha/beta-hydrolase [Mollisia scopiformis]KUJ10406.1 alpha/beta-hydrolase [Mollisia scopiformis]